MNFKICIVFAIWTCKYIVCLSGDAWYYQAHAYVIYKKTNFKPLKQKHYRLVLTLVVLDYFAMEARTQKR